MGQKIKDFLTILKNDAADTWNRCKIGIIAIGALILALEFRKLQEFLLVYLGQREINKAEAKDVDLSQKESDANNQANALITAAAEESNKEIDVNVDWNKK